MNSKVCEKARKPLARILGAGLARAGAEYAEVERAAEDAGRREVKRLSVKLRPLVVVAMIAPLLGLLGTVTGMIATFDILNTFGSGNSRALSTGISKALLEVDNELRTPLKRSGLLTRDPRNKERKKYGQKGARAKFQFSKR